MLPTWRTWYDLWVEGVPTLKKFDPETLVKPPNLGARARAGVFCFASVPNGPFAIRVVACAPKLHIPRAKLHIPRAAPEWSPPIPELRSVDPPLHLSCLFLELRRSGVHLLLSFAQWSPPCTSVAYSLGCARVESTYS